MPASASRLIPRYPSVDGSSTSRPIPGQAIRYRPVTPVGAVDADEQDGLPLWPLPVLNTIASCNPLDYIECVERLLTVVELPHYLRKAEALLSKEDRESAVSYLAAHPTAGVLLQGTCGIRKLRWATGGRGKSGGVRLVYYYCDAEIPLFMITVFAKNERANLSKAERNELAKLATALRDGYRGRRGRK
jgi:hypothetical protein